MYQGKLPGPPVLACMYLWVVCFWKRVPCLIFSLGHVNTKLQLLVGGKNTIASGFADNKNHTSGGNYPHPGPPPNFLAHWSSVKYVMHQWGSGNRKAVAILWPGKEPYWLKCDTVFMCSFPPSHNSLILWFSNCLLGRIIIRSILV